MRHWDKDRKLAKQIEPELCKEYRLQKNYLESGDILLATKGVDPFAAIYDGRYEPAVASSVFTVIRIKDPSTTLPEYLQWYLNHPTTTNTLVAASRGTSIPLITRDVVEELEIPLPSVNKQKQIVRLHELQQQAGRLRRYISKLEENLFQYHLLQTANGE